MIHGLARIINRKGEKIINAHSLYRGLAEFTNQITIVRHAANHMKLYSLPADLYIGRLVRLVAHCLYR